MAREVNIIEKKVIVGVDIGGTWVRVAICISDLNEKNIKIKVTPTLKESALSISKSVCELLEDLLKENSTKKDQIQGIGLASAGPLDMEKGEVFNNANLGFKTIPLRAPIQEKYPSIPIYLINDCRAAVLGVHYFEAQPEEKQNLVYITISTGIGGGVICNGHLMFGKEGNAGEIGHGVVDGKSKFKCNCGAYGCWEVYSSGTGVALRALEALKENKFKSEVLMKIVKNDKSKIAAKEVFQAAREGDPLSKKIVEDCVFYSKVGVGLVNNFYDPVAIYFGGAMTKDKELLINPLIEQFESNALLFTINHPPKIKLTKLGDAIGIKGALALVKHKLERNPIVS